VIGNRVSIGSRSLINNSRKIGDDAVVCPVSIVTTSVPGRSMVSGNPARIARSAKVREAKP
jgi:acetyltransferase-like isoleucine patch superfamily enzyme